MSRKETKNQKVDVSRRNVLLGGTTLAAASAFATAAQAQQRPAQAQAPAQQPAAQTGRKPNILFIMGDDIGWFNVSAYNMGVIGYGTPNIDHIRTDRPLL